MSYLPLILKHSSKRKEFITLFVLSLFCLGLSIFRVWYTEYRMYLFLNWNLFLAAIPWVVSTIVITSKKLRSKSWTLYLLLGSWLLFFPNAPYILTDLFHLRLSSSMPLWFDLVLIMSFAWTGLLFGFFSLLDLEAIMKERMPIKVRHIIITLLLFISAFGIYVGRFLRWNSWDILAQPHALIYDLAHRFIFPFEHPRTWGMTIFMGIFLNMVYWSLKRFKGNGY